MIDEPQRSWLPMAGAALLCGGVLFYLGRGTTFFYDDWSIVLGGRAEPARLLESHNGHLILLTRLIYRLLLATVGLRHYWVYRLVGIAFHLLGAGLLFAYARTRVPPLLAHVAAVSFLLFGASWQCLLWPFQICFSGAMAGGLALFLLLDRDDRLAVRGAPLALAASLASSGLGIPFALGALVDSAGRARGWRRLIFLAAPLVALGVWYVCSVARAHPPATGPRRVVGYVVSAAAGALGAVTSMGTARGRYLLVPGLAFLMWRTIFDRRDRARLAALVIMPLSFWALSALMRSGVSAPDAGRYLYPGGLFVWLLLIESVRRISFSRTAQALVLVAAATAAVRNMTALHAAAAEFRGLSAYVRAELCALEQAGENLDRQYRPDAQRMPQVTAGAYLDAVRDRGSPAFSLAEMAAAPADLRAAFERALHEAALRPSSAR